MNTTAIFSEKKNLFCSAVFILMSAAASGIAVLSAVLPMFYGDYNEISVLLLTICYSALAFIIFQMSRKLSEKKLFIILIFCMAAATFVQLWIAFSMKLIPRVDLSHIYEECVNMIEMEHPRITNYKYFGFYTNNIPVTIVIYLVFRLTDFLGKNDYRLAGGLLNTGMLLLMYIFSYKILRHITSMRTAFFLMFILLTNPVFFAYTSYYYTDIISLGFLMPGTYLLLRGMQTEPGRCRFVYFLLSGILIGLAAKIRITSIFIFFSVIVFHIILQKGKDLIRLLIPFLTGLIFFFLIWNRIYTVYVDFPTTESTVPATHFLMMGSHDNGTYDKNDVAFTRSFSSHEEKVENTFKMWLQHIKENGLSGNVRLFFTKEAIVWGIGDRGYLQYTKYTENETLCYRLIRGDLSSLFLNYMQSYNIILFVFISFGCATAALERRKDFLILAIYWGGAIVFYIFWEAHPRQSMSYLPLLTMMIVPWIEKNFSPYLPARIKTSGSYESKGGLSAIITRLNLSCTYFLSIEFPRDLL